MRFGAGIWLFGQFVDRYATDAYGPPVSTLEAIERAGEVGDLEVLDINYPFTEGVDGRRGQATPWRPPACARGASRRTSTRASSRAARSRTLIPPCAGARSSCASRASPSAKQLGAPTVKLWPGQDGFDFPLQSDYRELWRLVGRGRERRRRDGRRHPRGHRVQGQGAAHAHQLLHRGAHAAGHRPVGPRGHRHRGRPRALAVRQGGAGRRAAPASTTTASCSPSRSTTTGASGTTTCRSAAST